MNELESVYTYLKTLVDFDPSDMSPLVGNYEKVSYRAGDVIFNEGNVYRKVTFVLSGLVKKFYLTSAGNEYVKEFTWEGQITTPYASILRKVPASYTMEAIEDTNLLVMDYSIFERLSSGGGKWLALGKALSDFHFLNREDREMELLKYSATERYTIFKNRFPHLVGRIRKQDIASYLGISPVSLSRLESR